MRHAARFLSLAICLGASPALAQHCSSDAQGAYDGGDFDAAAAGIEDALARRSGLNRESLQRCLAFQASVAHARRNDVDLDTALARLLSLDPDAELPRVPPSVRRRLATLRGEVQGGLSIAAEQTPTESGAHLRLRARNDLGELVRGFVVHVRRGDGWDNRPGEQHHLDPGDRFYIEALGPGGAIVAQQGSPEAPLEAVDAIAAPVAVQEPDAPDAADASPNPWPWLGPIIGAVALGAAVGLAFALRPDNNSTTLSPPMMVP